MMPKWVRHQQQLTFMLVATAGVAACSEQLVLSAPVAMVAPPPPASAVVLLGPGASETEQFAAAEMAWFGGNITNRNQPLPILNLTDSMLLEWQQQQLDSRAAVSQLKIVVGYTAALVAGVPAAVLDNLGRDGLRVTVPSANNKLAPHTISLSGGNGAPRGAVYAVYEFLEHNGLEFLAWDATIVPSGSPTAALRIPEADIAQVPTSEYRSLQEWPVFSNRLHARRMRLNPDGHDECALITTSAWCKPPHLWDTFRFASPPGVAHTVYRLLCTNGTHVDEKRCPPLKPPQDLVKTHPEWSELQHSLPALCMYIHSCLMPVVVCV